MEQINEKEKEYLRKLFNEIFLDRETNKEYLAEWKNGECKLIEL